jgi:protein TonB
MNKNLILKTDILDIIFEKRNKAYGAYDLRKFYPNRLKLALGMIFMMSIVFFGFTLIPGKKSNSAHPIYKTPEPSFREVDMKPKEPEKKTEVIKPKNKPVEKATPVNQKALVSNIVVAPKNTKTDSIPTLLPTDVIGTKTVVTTTPGTPLVEPYKATPSEGGGDKAISKIDKTVPLEGDAVDVLPSYPGGMEAFRLFMKKNLETPDELENGETVSVRVKFVVDYSGKLKSFVTVLDGGEVYNKEVIRVLKKMPDWIPGKAKGENVSVYHIIPVKFVSAD